MPLYRFQCDHCGATDLDQMTFAEHDIHRVKYPTGYPCSWECKGSMLQVLDFHFNRGMTEHYSDTLDAVVSSDSQFKSVLSRQQDEMSQRMGYDVNYEAVDPSDTKSLNVTEDGLEATERAAHAEKNDGHKTVFS